MKRIAVFCGSRLGTKEIYQLQAYNLGKTLALNKIGLVYGGSKTGLMGALANGVIDNLGETIGVLPRFLEEKELAHEQLSQLISVETMHERKAKMNELSDGVIMLPGGLGSLEEFFEMLTWAQLGLHKKAIAILNIDGFFDQLLSLFQNMSDNGFISEGWKNTFIISDSVDEILIKIYNSICHQFLCFY